MLCRKHKSVRNSVVNRKTPCYPLLPNRLVCTERSSRPLERITAYRAKTEKAPSKLKIKTIETRKVENVMIM